MLSCLSLLLAVTTLVQDSVAPARPAPRKVRRTPFVTTTPPTPTVEPFIFAPMAIEAMPPIEAMPTIAPMMIEAMPLIAAMPTIAPMAIAIPDLQAATAALAMAAPNLGMLYDESWDDLDVQEPGDSLYQAGRRALNNNRYQEAATTFGQVASRYPRSARAPEAMYWQAFALYRTGDTKNLNTAVSVLDSRRKSYPTARTRDAANLAARIDGVLAQRGDREAAERNAARADSMRSTKPAKQNKAERDDGDDDTPPGCEGYGDDDPRMIALNALLQMNAENAIPILRDVLKRRDPCSEIMRRKAVFIVSQKRTAETSRILLDAARTDPDREVRGQAIFWLSQVPGDSTVIALDSILQASTDPELQEKALFALSQHRSPKAGAALRAFAERRDADPDMREKAIFWLGQNRTPENAAFLKGLFAKVESDDLKEKIIFSLSQMGGSDNYRWLMDIALNQNENIEIRKKALFWAGQGHDVQIEDLIRLYDSMKDREMREQLIFVYSQRREEAASDKLCQIGKTDPDRELRKKAIFWLGQSRSPRAVQCLQELINQ
jgi:TolA-binding protein